MKYAKPILIAMTAGEPIPACDDGSGASGSGCTEGYTVYIYCALGDGNDGCMDGSTAAQCSLGSDAVATTPRCLSGNSPSWA